MTRLKEINSVVWLPSVWDRRRAQHGEALVRTVKYLGRYVNRAAISNSRLVAIEGEDVLFCYKDYRDKDQWKTERIPGVEFIGRFLLHLLPKGLRHIRRFGFMGPRVATERLNKIRAILGIGRNEADASTGESEEPKPPERDEEPDGPAPRRCRQCHGGQMLLVAETRRPTVAELLQMPPSMELWWPMPRPEPCETPLNLIPRKEPPANSRQVQLHLSLSAGL